MWRLLKAEFRYNAVILTAIAGCFTLIYTTLSVIPDAQRFASGLLGVPFMLLVFIPPQIHFREKRSRYHTLLPIPAHQVGLARIAMIVLLAYGMAAQLAVIHTLPMIIDDIEFWHPSILAAEFVIMIALVFLVYDLYSIFIQKYKYELIAGAVLLGILMNVFFVFVYSQKKSGNTSGFAFTMFRAMGEFVKYLLTPDGAVVFNIACLILAGLTVVTFVRRKSYV